MSLELLTESRGKTASHISLLTGAASNRLSTLTWAAETSITRFASIQQHSLLLDRESNGGGNYTMPAAVLEPHPSLLVPFAILLVSIAMLPLILRHHWERHYAKLCAALAAIPCAYYIFGLHAANRVLTATEEYASFIVVVGAFFVVAGGIHVHIPRPASPLGNAALLFGGTLLANCIGTIGASMLLIRPWLHINRTRFQPAHLAFFIFTVSNLGGALSPIGPPLFLGYQKGIPFRWAVLHCWRPWLVAMAALLLIFIIIDAISWCRRPREPRAHESHFYCQGKWNFLVLLALLIAVVFVATGLRELLMVGLAVASYRLTPTRVFEANEFRWEPLIEVGWIFLGIFGTMIPVLDYVALHAASFHLGHDAQFYWSTGLLSGVLDNAPSYLTFLAAALSLDHLDINSSGQVAQFAAAHVNRLGAISIAATFFGGLTYIGNGPNLLVRAIAQSRDARTPGFLPYILKYALPILLPVLGLIGFAFFRG
jgi:Na+/H+ antiporter NhaD/arsenite permease-like protein